MQELLGTAAAAYIAQQLFGKTLAEMGDDLNKIYKSNRDKLLAKAAKKVLDPNDGAKPNFRVARDIIWNGAATDDEVCAEYFGGLLAASRSEDGKDDSALIYVDCIKALSSKQLHLHFCIYHALNEISKNLETKINPGMQDEFSQMEVWFFTNELTKEFRITPPTDLNILHRQGLIASYATNIHKSGGKILGYTRASPTTFGVLLYAAALNKISNWNNFGHDSFAYTSDISVPKFYSKSFSELCALAGISDIPENN